ncbi:MAG: endonuclease/exonuclease/phosphatase family protein [Clostridia bacterium]|nr:endonuclease/exonuclease/phosphatase family protein [Clostridia bacterium]
MKIRIGTFNIQHGINYPHYLKNGEAVIDLKSCADQIAATGLDICGLNEVYNEAPKGKIGQAEFIGNALGFNHRFARAIDISCGEYGNAAVSRYPIKSVETFPIEVKEADRKDYKGYENRVLLHAVIDVEGTELSVYICHFGLAPDEQDMAEKTVTDLLKNDKRPLVFMGDFNITPDNAIIGHFRDFLFDSSTLVKGNTLTFPSDVPVKQIDYIFTNDKVKVISASVTDVSCSDHREYFADIEF